MHRIFKNSELFYKQKIKEVYIILKSTTNKKFARCNNSKCNFVFEFEPREIIGEIGLLCPACRKKANTHHVVQCENCQSIVNLIKVGSVDYPEVFYVKKCSKCKGTLEDERRVESHSYPGLFI